MNRTMYTRAVAAMILLACSVLSGHVGVAVGSATHETEITTGASCGVERWDVKTGMDTDARLVRQAQVISTTVLQLRSLTAPVQPPLHHRVRPAETTVWAIDATLLRYKQEADSDYHLVVADSSGRTMIVEIAPPQCISATSPFLPAIRVVRRVFTAQFHPTPFWQRPVHVKVHVVGVGFFDFKHGQSGVAPNAIELHPVLGIWWSGAPPASSTAGTTPTPAPSRAGSLVVRVTVSPDPTATGTDTTVSATTATGAVCTAEVRYPSGHTSTSAALATSQTADASGHVAWTWRLSGRTPGTALATVHCARGTDEGIGTAAFTIN